MEKRSGGIFEGTVDFKSIVDESIGARDLMLGFVSFPKGARNKFHYHFKDQVLYVTGGRGIVATEKEQHIVEAGDVVLIPGGERHSHGATKDSYFSHIFVCTAGDPGKWE